MFSDKLVVVYNQLPGVSSMVNLATLYSNPINYMQIELAYGAKTEFTSHDGYRILVPTYDQSGQTSQGLHLKVIPFCATDLIRHMPP